MRLVSFTAGWCEFCKKFAPTVSEFASQSDLSVDVLDIDVAENKALFKLVNAKYGIKTIPCIALFDDDNVLAAKADSSASVADITKMVEEAL